MREPKVYRATIAPPSEDDAIPFTIEGVNKDGTEVVDSFTFTAYGHSDDAGIAMTILDFLRRDDQGRVVTDLGAIKGLFERVLPAEQYALFCGLLARQDIYLQMPVLSQIYNDLVEEFTGRPTEKPSGSSSGPSTDGKNSTAPPPSPEST